MTYYADDYETDEVTPERLEAMDRRAALAVAVARAIMEITGAGLIGLLVAWVWTR